MAEKWRGAGNGCGAHRAPLVAVVPRAGAEPPQACPRPDRGAARLIVFPGLDARASRRLAYIQAAQWSGPLGDSTSVASPSGAADAWCSTIFQPAGVFT